MAKVSPSSRVLAVIGPSGTGKSTVMRELSRRGLVTITPTYTTRPKRPDESDDTLEHRYVSEAEFHRLEQEGFFLGSVTMFGLPYRYGLPAVEIDPSRVSAILLRASLVERVAPVFDPTVYQVEDSIESAERRLRQRGAELGSRLADYRSELAHGRLIAHRVFVNSESPINLADQIESAIRTDFAL